MSREHGEVTGLWLTMLRRFFGWGVYVVPLGLAVLGAYLMSLGSDHPLELPASRLFGLLCAFVSGLALSHHFLDRPKELALAGQGGGYLGYWVSHGLFIALGWLGATVLLVTLIAVGLTVALEVPLVEVTSDSVTRLRGLGAWLSRLVARLRERRARRRAEARAFSIGLPSQSSPRPGAMFESRSLEPPAERGSPNVGRSAPDPTPRSDVPAEMGRRWDLPVIEEVLVVSDETSPSLSDIREKTHIIEETLYSLGVPVTVVEVNPGPGVTQ